MMATRSPFDAVRRCFLMMNDGVLCIHKFHTRTRLLLLLMPLELANGTAAIRRVQIMVMHMQSTAARREEALLLFAWMMML